MGRKLVLDLLKKNSGQFLSASEISKEVGLNVQSTYSVLKRMLGAGEIQSKQFKVKQGPPKKLYGYLDKDDHFEDFLHLYHSLKAQSRFNFVSLNCFSNMMILKELKEIKEVLKNGRK